MPQSLVIGGSGFVGRTLVEQLIARGEKVTVISRRPPPSDAEWLALDITDAEALARALNGRQFDAMHHTASLPGDTGNPEEMMRVNVAGLQTLLEFARYSPSSRFVLTSSISAHGWYPPTPYLEPLALPVGEDHPCWPRDMYCLTKRMQEELALTYFHQFGVPVVILRLPSVMGPNASGGSQAWGDFARQARAGGRVPVPMHSAEEINHYVDVRDVATAHILAATVPQAVGEIFNIAGPKEISGRELAEVIRQLIPASETYYADGWTSAQGHQLYFDIDKAERILGYHPRYGVADSLRDMLAAAETTAATSGGRP